MTVKTLALEMAGAVQIDIKKILVRNIAFLPSSIRFFNLNVPLKEGIHDEAYFKLFDE